MMRVCKINRDLHNQVKPIQNVHQFSMKSCGMFQPNGDRLPLVKCKTPRKYMCHRQLIVR